MKTLQISDELRLPLDIIVRRTAEYGDSGSGKTAFARLMAEKVHEAGQRFCAIDLKNDWWGLKSSADGLSAGIPVVIFGGPRADVKLPDDPAAAATLADTITSIDQSIVIDLDSMSRKKQEKFLAGFLDRLYEANRNPLLLFCDEADRYAPQKPMSEQAILSLSSSEDIARRGRKRGVGSFWLTQRTAVLNKNVSEFANLTVVFRTPGSKDLDELEDRVGRITTKEVVKEVMRIAPGLNDGEAFFLSSHPKIRNYLPSPVRPIQLPLPRTFDSSATPSVGSRRREPKVLAQTDLAAIETKMAAQVQRAKEEDPKHLKAEVTKLRAELQKAQKTPPKIEPKIVEKLIVTDAQVKEVVGVAKTLEREGKRRIDAAETLAKSGQELIQTAREFAVALGKAQSAALPLPLARAAVHAFNRMPVAGAVRVAPPPRPRSVPRMTVSRPKAETNGEAGEWFMPAHQRLLDAVAWLNTFGIARPDRSIVAAVAGVSPRSSSFGNNVSRLSAKGLIRYPQQGQIELTDQGQAMSNAPQAAPTLASLHDAWRTCPALTPAHVRLLNAVIAAYPNEMSREQLAESVGVSPLSSSFGNDVSRLSSMGLIRYPQRGFVVASELLFPPGFQ